MSVCIPSYIGMWTLFFFLIPCTKKRSKWWFVLFFSLCMVLIKKKKERKKKSAFPAPCRSSSSLEFVSRVLKLIRYNTLYLQRIAYCITPEHEHHLVAEGNVRQFKVSAAFVFFCCYHESANLTPSPKRHWCCPFLFSSSGIGWPSDGRKKQFPHPSSRVVFGAPVCHQWLDTRGERQTPTSLCRPLSCAFTTQRPLFVNSGFKHFDFRVIPINILE